MSLHRALAALVSLICLVTAAPMHGQVYSFTAPVTGYTEADLSFGPPSTGASDVNFGTLCETVYLDLSAQTIRQVGTVSISPTSAMFPISYDNSDTYTGQACLTINSGVTNISFDTGPVTLQNGGGDVVYAVWALPVPVSGECTVFNDSETNSGLVSYTVDVPIVTSIALDSSSATNLSLSESSDAFGTAQMGSEVTNIGGATLYDDTSDGTYYCQWEAPDVSALAISPGISTNPVSEAVCLGATVSFTVGATGTNLTYEWFFNGQVLTDGPQIAGSESDSLTVSNASVDVAGSYQVLITNDYGAALSAAVLLSITNVPPLFFTNGMGIALTNGSAILQLTNLTGQGPLVLEASCDLTNWIPILTNPPAFGVIQMLDTNASNFDQRFYRIATQ